MKQEDTNIKETSDKADNQAVSTNDPYQIGLNKLPEILKQDLDKNLCDCNCVPKSVVIQAICDGADTFMKVRAKTYASAGNGCCRQEIESLVECLITDEKQSDENESPKIL